MKQWRISPVSDSNQPHVLSYNVTSNGYYCADAVVERENHEQVVPLPNGYVDFHNTFSGNLPASAYFLPALYGYSMLIYVILGLVWHISSRPSHGYFTIRWVQMISSFAKNLILLSIVDSFLFWLYYTHFKHTSSGLERLRGLGRAPFFTALSQFLLIAACGATALRISYLIHGIAFLAYKLAHLQALFNPGSARAKTLVACSFITYALSSFASVEAILDRSTEKTILYDLPLFAMTVLLCLYVILFMIILLKNYQRYRGSYKQSFVGLVLAVPTSILFALMMNTGLTALFVTSSGQQDVESANTWEYLWMFLEAVPRLTYTACMSQSYITDLLLFACLLAPQFGFSRLLSAEMLRDEEDPTNEYEVGSIGER